MQRPIVEERDLHSCVGAAVQNTHEAYHIQTETPLKENVPFVAAAGRLLYLWPLLLHRVSPLSDRHTLYTFEELPDRNRPFLTATRCAAINRLCTIRLPARRTAAACRDVARAGRDFGTPS